MAHAQRLLPMEQLLSGVAASSVSGSGVGAPPRPSVVPQGDASTRKIRFPQDAGPAAGSSHVSPFDADSARKGGPRQESASNPAPGNVPRMVASGSPPARVVMGAAAPANLSEDAADLEPTLQTEPDEPKLQVAPLPHTQSAAIVGAGATAIERLRGAVLQALADGNQRILVSMLDAGEWSVEGNEVVVKVSESQTVVDLSLGTDARRLAIASASGVLGRAVKLRIVPGAAVAGESKSNGNAAKSSGTSLGGGRSRAEQDAVVRRLQEKFGAEIRTVIDYKEKR